MSKITLDLLDEPRLLDFRQFEHRAADFDSMVERTPEIDLFCSTSAWVLPARAAFAPRARPFVISSSAGYVALMSVPTLEAGRALLPLEASWGLASPFAGPEPEPLVEHLFRLLDVEEPPAMAMFLSGIDPHGRAWRAIERATLRSQRWRFLGGPTAGRHVADIHGGVDAFFARRSPKFRANVRRERRQAAAAGVTYEYLSRFPTAVDVAALYQRIQAVEVRSWKGVCGQGINLEPAYSFYRQMVARLAATRKLRVVFAQRDGEDIAHVFGGLCLDTYRGLQCSYADEHRSLAPGVLVHTEMIERLSAEGICVYDLGSEMDYKRRWGEDGLRTQTLVVVRSS